MCSQEDDVPSSAGYAMTSHAELTAPVQPYANTETINQTIPVISCSGYIPCLQALQPTTMTSSKPSKVSLTSSSQSPAQHSDKFKKLVCDYIDQLIEENEMLTQISQSYTIPTPLCFENEDYFHEVFSCEYSYPTERFKMFLNDHNYSFGEHNQ